MNPQSDLTCGCKPGFFFKNVAHLCCASHMGSTPQHKETQEFR